ncbi:MAG TPA: zf-HC2 domain-containing protein [Actinomycetota bacterium]|nr:zf-HC2 domain-containing protein [Actinomycetota bacterium]
MNVRELSCKELVELVTDYLEGALSRRDRKRFERHIAACHGCTAYLEQMRVTIRLTGELVEEDLSEPARGELLAAFRSWSATP